MCQIPSRINRKYLRVYDPTCNYKGIPGAEDRGLQSLITGTGKIFAGLLIGDDIPVICAELMKGFELTGKILFLRADTGVVESFSLHADVSFTK